jgi:hypothetical protein
VGHCRRSRRGIVVPVCQVRSLRKLLQRTGHGRSGSQDRHSSEAGDPNQSPHLNERRPPLSRNTVFPGSIPASLCILPSLRAVLDRASLNCSWRGQLCLGYPSRRSRAARVPLRHHGRRSRTVCSSAILSKPAKCHPRRPFAAPLCLLLTAPVRISLTAPMSHTAESTSPLC